jgi:excisionase family DNA binding protein
MTGALLDSKGAAELLNVPASWILAEARADRIPHIRLGRYVRFDADQLREWCQSRGRGPGPGDRIGGTQKRPGSACDAPGHDTRREVLMQPQNSPSQEGGD